MLPLEDSFHDIINKAQRGWQISSSILSGQAGVPLAGYERVRKGEFDEEIVRKVAVPLRLDVDRLVASGRKEWHPGSIDVPPGLASATTDYGDMTVNAYLVWDPATREAAIFDTGADAAPLLQIIRENELIPKFIFLTHTHEDHIADLPNLARSTGATFHVHKNEAVGRAKPFEWGEVFPVGSLKIETRQTTGHALGGTSYVIRGLNTPVAIVGDAIFAGSMGGGAISYTEALRTNRENIFSLPEETILCPGHGPLTTVGLEKKHNPFFPGL